MTVAARWLRLTAMVALGVVGIARPHGALAEDLPRCEMIATGGTIAMRFDPVQLAVVPALSGDALLATVPELAKVARVRVRNLFSIPSEQMDPQRWVAIHREVLDAVSAADVAGIMITHGTDTLEETAYFLDLTVQTEKPIVIVGAQRSASDRDSDGPRNLLNASRVCVDPAARGRGVMVVMNEQIDAAREATKTHTSDVGAFQSGRAGSLGVIDDGRVTFARISVRRQHIELRNAPLPRVDIVAMYPGADGALLRAAVGAGAKGIVVQALGNGNVNEAMAAAIIEAVQQGVAVVIATRVPNGRVVPTYGLAGGGKTLQQHGTVFAGDLAPHKARILLMLALQSTSSAARIQQIFDR